ncbi:hypothetical protein K438DRAFT_1768188 [Mycena galopus ATCC 62051]|nr:hypothetical protein K438DRAFT_1768188 [Mycena galopus ATCC 62051]
MSAANKPSRNRNPSRKVADDANSEAPSAAHQEVLAIYHQALGPAARDGARSLGFRPQPHRIITSLAGLDEDIVAAAFTRRFDVLFGNDCRGADGLFTNIRRGDRGMTAVVVYLQSIHWASAQIPLDLAVKRLTALDTDLRIICAAAAKPAKKSKRVDKPDETPDHLVEQATEKQNDPPKAGMKWPHWEQRMDQIFTAAIKPSKKAKNADPGDGFDSDDTDYRPRKPRAVSEESQDDFEVNEVGKAAPEKCKLIVLDDEDSGAEEKSKSKSKKKLGRPRKKAKQAPEGAALPKISVIELDDTDDEATAQTKQGPANTSRDHFHPPVAVSNNLGKRWEFKCRHCTSSLTVKRTVSRTATFEDEKPQPAIGNLATHLRKHGDDLEIPGSAPAVTHGVSAASVKIMEDFLREGRLNSAIIPTQLGFNKVFAAWIIEDDHPFTTGQTDGIHRLFQYMESRFLLPSDTTVRNALTRIYTDMFDNLSDELAVNHVKSKIAASTDAWSTESHLREQSQAESRRSGNWLNKLLAALEEAEDPAIDDYYLANKDLPFHYDSDDDPEVMALEMEKFTKAHDATTEEDSDVQLMTSLGSEFEKLSALGKVA